MRKFIPFVICAFLFCGSESLTAAAQTQKNPQKQPTPKTKTLDISKVDFKNFTYPAPNGTKPDKSFVLRNGASISSDFPNFRLRKTYYFDLTGDGGDEAITHIIADGCRLGCESSSLFFIYTRDEKETRLLWKIAVGGDAMGGLKEANFTEEQIVLETFGDCALEGWLITPKVDVKTNPTLKIMNYTRFVFAGDNFTQISKNVLPLARSVNLTNYRPKISFGDVQQ